MNVETHCPVCLRRERWSVEDGAVRSREVLIAGGARRPSEAPPLAAWRVLRRVRDGELSAVVGACEGCEQPMATLEPGLSSVPWTLETPLGSVVVDGELTGPDGALTDDELTAFLERQYAGWNVPSPGMMLFSSFAGLSIVLPVLLWSLALIAVSGFIYSAVDVNLNGF